MAKSSANREILMWRGRGDVIGVDNDKEGAEHRTLGSTRFGNVRVRSVAFYVLKGPYVCKEV